MFVPSDYREGYEKARAVAPDIAENYIAHTLIGDLLGEAMTADLAELGTTESRRLIEAAMQQEDKEALRDAPASLREFFRDAETPPEWLDYAAFAPSVRMFHRNSPLILAAFVAGVLIEGFTTNIAKSFHINGRVRDQGVRRLGQNNRHMMEIFLPNGMYRYGDGWKLFGPYQNRSRTDKTPPAEQLVRGMGRGSLGSADQRGAPGLRHFRFFGEVAETHENLGRQVQ